MCIKLFFAVPATGENLPEWLGGQKMPSAIGWGLQGSSFSSSQKNLSCHGDLVFGFFVLFILVLHDMGIQFVFTFGFDLKTQFTT